VLPAARRIFQAFPEVIGIDGTHETNNEGRPLITITVKDSNGNVIVVIRCLAPNERSWVFRWLLQEALPPLIGKETLARVQVVITDGDPQEMTQVDYAIMEFFLNAIRVRCGWHAVIQGWARCCTGLGHCKGKKKEAEIQKSILQTWMLSWMRSGVKTREEYEM
jgi:hypothetical protein